ncbi:glycosyltransferase family 4 protein [Paenibacillus alkaliterrae]|uniref:glycosyltransferase family 4 protein n=1 Tax=Paenibacillus alkaliterrae TaxID=320909 RepID=UPI001F2DB722|nr:glycosyltransferase family 4 protein [Paenibacillus alkaliterrae]MCF2941694.1 glycosyltransferase family 4 protein [Paenibacillus alkaliterrae]
MNNLDIVYVLESTVLSGGIKNVFEQVDRLADLGYRTQLFALGDQPAWFPLNTKVRKFPNYAMMQKELKSMNAIKIATWWKTLSIVLNSCDPRQGGRGIPFYLVQDIEESYYPHWPAMQEKVRQTYRMPVHLLTIADWTAKQLDQRFGREATNISIAIDLNVLKPNRTREYDPNRILACSRKSQHLKGFHVTVEAVEEVYRKLGSCSFVTFGLEDPQISEIPHIHYHGPDDRMVAELYANCGVFVQTSFHEGFGLPILEAMACGAPVVATNADGNEEFCHDGWNCVLVEKGDVEGVVRGMLRVLTDREFADYLSVNGRETARKYTWTRVLQNLDDVFSGYCHP